MTLKKQFQTLFNNTVVNENRVDKSVKIADEFAIGFAEWMAKEYWLNSSGKFRKEQTHKELLEIYKKEKGL